VYQSANATGPMFSGLLFAMTLKGSWTRLNGAPVVLYAGGAADVPLVFFNLNCGRG